MKTFLTNCVNCGDGSAINEMVDKAKDIKRRTFLKHVNRESLRQIERELGYAAHPKQNMTMASDWHVSYAKSEYKGKPCVYFVWSAIEYIFC